MKKLFSLAIVVLAMVLLSISACSHLPKKKVSSVTKSGDIEQQVGLVHLVPVPLYGMPEMSLGARWQQEAGGLMLELCDTRQRLLQQGKPLVLYIDGELAYLTQSTVAHDASCHDFDISEDQLKRVSSAKRAILRVFFEEEVVEQRISGTMSDYFSRPKFYGPQARLQQFIDALTSQQPENQLVGG